MISTFKAMESPVINVKQEDPDKYNNLGFIQGLLWSSIYCAKDLRNYIDKFYKGN